MNSPWLTAFVILLISAVALVGHYDAKIVTELFRGPEEIETSDEGLGETEEPPISGFSLSGESVIVVESDNFFSGEAVAAMRDIVEELEGKDFVSRVLWMDKIPMLNIFGLPEPLLPHESASEIRFNAAREKARKHPFIEGQLLSEDGKTTLLLVSFDRFFVQSDEQLIGGIRQVAENVAAQHPGFEADFTVTGGWPIWITARKTSAANTFYFQLIGYSMIALMSVILFRGLAAVLVVALAPSMGVFWTLGFIQFFDFKENPFNDVVLPVLVSLIALTDGVHLMVQTRKLRSQGLSPREAAVEGVKHVGLACALTSLTTAIGFGSLALANHELVQQFGVSCVIGVLLSFVAVVTTIPLVCSTWVGNFIQVGQEKSLVDKNLNKIGRVIDFVLPRKRWVSWVAILSTIAFIAVSLGLRPDERQSSIIPQGSEAAIGLGKLDKAMGGLESSSVDVAWTSDIASDSPAVLEVVTKVDKILADESLVGQPISICKLIDSLPGDGKAEDRMSMLELLPPSFKRSYYTPESNSASVSFRVRDLGIASYHPVFSRIQSRLADLKAEHPEFEFELSGDAVWRWQNLFQIVIDLATSLGTAVLIIFFVLALVYRSLTIGLISLVPNLFPLAMSGVYLVATGQALEVVTVCAFTVCLGIAVDDTIHFLTRYQEELAVTGDKTTAIRNAFTGVGTALILTTVVLVSGFGTVLFSDSRDHFIFASMGMITLSAALFADLVFLPALLDHFGGDDN